MMLIKIIEKYFYSINLKLVVKRKYGITVHIIKCITAILSYSQDQYLSPVHLSTKRKICLHFDYLSGEKYSKRLYFRCFEYRVL